MPVFGQLREARHRWFGHAVNETVGSGAGPTRDIHREEASIYFMQTDATTPNLTLRLPYDVRNYALGMFVVVVNNDKSGGGQSIDIVDGSDNALATLAAGSSCQIILTDASTADGTWLILTTTGSQNGRTPLS